jgi:predicted transcriptional regulator
MPAKGDRKYSHRLEEWISRYQSGEDILEIAEDEEACSRTIRNYLKEEGIDLNNRKYDHLVDEWVNLYTEQDWSTSRIADEYGLTASTISRYLDRGGVDTSRSRKYTDKEDEWVQRVNQGEFVKNIADDYEASQTLIRRRIQESDEAHLQRSPRRFRKQAEEWERLYREEDCTLEDISHKYEACAATIGRHLKETRGVPLRRGGRKPLPDDRQEAVHAYVEKDQCWEWSGPINGDHGYGIMHWNGEKHRAHRFAYEAFEGEIPEGKVIRHRCDNKTCVNPDHLEVGTAEENMQDVHQTRRDIHNLTRTQIREITRRADEDWLNLAEEYGVRVATIRYLLE